MEVCGVVSNQSFLCFSQSCSSSSSRELKSLSGSVVMNRRRVSTGFYDQGHLKYYCKSSKKTVAVVTTDEKELKKLNKKNKNKKEKKQLKLLKGLSKDLSTFSGIGFGLDHSDGALVDQVQGNIISEASELLLKQLQKLKAEKKEQKQKKKEEKIRLKAIKIQNRHMGGETSSSSSSESSSDSECGEVVDMNSLKVSQPNKIATPEVVQEPMPPVIAPVMPVLPSSQSLVSENSQVSLLEESQIAKQDICVSLSENSRNSSDTSCSKKIEVCMGGKCKKSGAAELLDKFQSVVGIEGSVSGCKCMGKCRDGPNVKVVEVGLAENSVRSPSNPLCIGVGLEDVEMIVANFLGENQNQLEFAV